MWRSHQQVLVVLTAIIRVDQRRVEVWLTTQNQYKTSVLKYLKVVLNRVDRKVVTVVYLSKMKPETQELCHSHLYLHNTGHLQLLMYLEVCTVSPVSVREANRVTKEWALVNSHRSTQFKHFIKHNKMVHMANFKMWWLKKLMNMTSMKAIWK